MRTRVSVSRWRFVFWMAVTGCGTNAPQAPTTPAPPPVSTTDSGTTEAAPETRSPPAARERPTLLIMPLRAEKGLDKAARALDEMILAAVDELGRHRVLGPADLNAILGVEEMKDALGCDDVSCAAEIGGALGAPFLVAGQLRALGDQAVLSLRLMDTRAPAVLERSTARGAIHAEALAKVMAVAVGDLFRVEITPSATTVAPEVTAPAGGYDEYTAMMQKLAKRMGRRQFAAMLADVARYEKREIKGPAGINVAEYLLFYRVTACLWLRRNDCVRRSAKKYLAQWPDGVYASTMEGYLDQLIDADLQRKAKKQEVEQRVTELREQQAEGRISLLQAREMIAYAYYGGGQYDRAARAFEEAWRGTSEVKKKMELLNMLAMCLDQTGEYAKARQLLEGAERLDPQQFRLLGLHKRLKMLPQ